MGTARLSWLVVAPAIAGGALISCTEVDSPTDLAPEGPPMVRQVFMKESVNLGSPGLYSFDDVLPYGSHPEAQVRGIQHATVKATARPGSQAIRVVIDELLVGNYLEEIACRGPVDGDAYSAVPLGATPDDIADCAQPADVLAATCTGDHAVCVDQTNAPPCAGGPTPCAPGLSCVTNLCVRPVGVLDEQPTGSPDGAADDSQFIAGAVGIRCGTIDVPLDLQGSYWQPSGNQQVPSAGGLSAIGPAVVLAALNGLPTGKTCSVYFNSSIVDKGNNQVCAPKWGPTGAPDDVQWPPTVPCTAGDTSDIQFTVEPLVITGGASINFPVEGQIDYPTSSPITMEFNAKMDLASFANLTFSPPAPMTPVVTLNVVGTGVLISIPGGLAGNTMYTLSIPAPADTYGGTLAAPFVIHFTTAP